MERFKSLRLKLKEYLLVISKTLIKFVKNTYIICKAFITWFRYKMHILIEDAGQETGILALSLIVNRKLHPLERFLWLIIVFISTWGAITLSLWQINRYYFSPTVISVDRDYRGWNGTLPAVTLCYYDHIDSYKATEYIQENWNVSIIDEDYFYFMDFLYSVVNASASNYADLARFAEDERFDDIDLFDLVTAIDRPFDQVLNSFDADFEVQVVPVMTERGSCYAINSPMSEILTGRYVELSDLKPPLTCQYGKQLCYIKMDLYESTGTINVHSPYEVSATDASVIALQKSDEIISSYKVLETVASKGLRDLHVEQRKCVFNDEETSQLKIYSRTLCLVRCRAIMALEMCNCVPFFYPFVDGPGCNPAGFECLLDFKWPVWALHICKCPSTCTEIEYSVQTVKKSSWGVKTNEDGLKSDIASSSFRWDLIPPKVRMRRDVVFSFEDLLVSFGGVLALFLGFSLLAVTQLGFVLVFHLLQSFYDFFIGIQQMCRGLGKHFKKLQTIKVIVPNSVSTSLCAKILNLKLKRHRLIQIHRKKSEEDIGENDVNVEDSNTNLNESFAVPEFEYLN